MPCVRSFCGKELAIGARVAGIFTIVIALPMLFAGYKHVQSVKELDETNYLDYNYGAFERLNLERKFMLQIGASYIAFGVLFIVMSICLLIGTANKNPRYLWPWIIIVGMAIGYILVRLSYHGFIDPILPRWEPYIGLLLLFNELYFYIIVYSFKQECVEELVAAFHRSLDQPNTVLGTQQYTAVSTVGNAKDLPPPYHAYSMDPPPPPYSAAQNSSSPSYIANSSLYTSQQYGVNPPTDRVPSAPPTTDQLPSAPPTTSA